MSKEERYAEHTVAWELPNGDSITKSNYNLAGIETKYIPIQTEVISDDKDKKIADLEAKLAQSKMNESFEKEKKENAWEFIKELKQQLAEKEGKIETLKQRIDSIVKIYSDDFVSKDTELKELRHKVKQHHQDKISFAVEQLEKVKEWANDYYGECSAIVITHFIDNQIKQLKEMK